VSPEHVFVFRAVIVLIAGSFLLFIALFLLRSVFRGGRRIARAMVRVTALLVCAWLVTLAGQGSIGAWGAWIGIGGASVVTVLSFIT
jgi:O-antigen/teichoic acid export membrane protein